MTSHRLFAVALAAAVLGTAAPARATTAPDEPSEICSIHALDQPGFGTSALVTSIDRRGRWLAGTASASDESYRPVVWEQGIARILDVPADSAEVTGINRDGTAVGLSRTDGPAGVKIMAYAMTADGDYVRLAKPAGTRFAEPTGISDNGVISGYALPRTGSEVPVTWSLERPGAPKILDLPPGSFGGRAVDVDHRGRILLVAHAELERTFVISPSGRSRELEAVHDGYVEGTSITDGWVAAFELDDVGAFHPTRFRLRTGAAEAIEIPGFESLLRIGGRTGILGGSDIDGAVIYTDRVVQLPGLPDGFSGAVHAIDRRGRAYGYAGTDSGDLAAVRWRCDG